ncbi:MAG: hypothetical protein DCC67_14645 [Planctomycetota bacterium]|nr:MAG: hypothetical protein DCC67_14645 [Planctomycetota bacterium]
MYEIDFADRYRRMQRYVDWSADDAARVAKLWPLVRPHAPALVADFYAEVFRHPEAARVITGGQPQLERLHRTLFEWLEQLLCGPYDEAYMRRRWQVGHRHVEIGLAQRFTSLALARLRTGLNGCVRAHWLESAAELAAALDALNKLLDLDHALIQDAYEYEHARRVQQLERERGERMFRTLVEGASCLIMIFDRNREVAYFNPYAQRLTGYSAEEMRRDPQLALAALRGARPATEDRVGAVLGGSPPVTYEAMVSSISDRAVRYVNWTLSRIDDFDGGPALLAVGHDVTEQKLSAAQLLQASRLATIGEMYARLAHESRNSLQRLRGVTELLAEEVRDRPAAATLVERSEQAQADLQRLLDEVRNFASPLVLEPTECRLPALWREAWTLLQIARDGRDARLIDDSDPHEAAPVMNLDRFRMVQAFRNIFENSLASANGGRVEIRVRHQRIRGDDGRPWREISIHDNGPGFTPEALLLAFEPFFTTRNSGTGLGLAIVHRTIEAHGGRTDISNQPGGGARIVIRLPHDATARIRETGDRSAPRR